MMKPTLHRRGGETVFGAVADARDINPWAPTVAQAREVLLRFGVVGPDWTLALPLLPEAGLYVPSQREVERVSDFCRAAVIGGRFIDMGYLPNDVIKHGGDRGGTLWNEGAIGMPFSEPWILYHLWERATSIYLVNPLDDQEFEVCELDPAVWGGERMLCISDRGSFDRVEGLLATSKYHCRTAPCSMRYLADPARRTKANNGMEPTGACAANVGDPVMTALLILNTRGVARETVLADAKLQRARARSGKAPIPSYDRVLSEPYVTAVQARGRRTERGEGQGGTHRSPVPHIRMGHPRQYASGRSIFIADTLVNVPEEQRAAFKSQRSHYRVNVDARKAVQD